MKFQIDGPASIEARKIEAKDNKLIVTPNTIRGQHIVRVGYVTAKGDGGTESKAVVLFNANTGVFSIQGLDGDPATFDFDRPRQEFESKRAASRKAGQRGQQARRANQQQVGADES